MDNPPVLLGLLDIVFSVRRGTVTGGGAFCISLLTIGIILVLPLRSLITEKKNKES